MCDIIEFSQQLDKANIIMVMTILNIIVLQKMKYWDLKITQLVNTCPRIQTHPSCSNIYIFSSNAWVSLHRIKWNGSNTSFLDVHNIAIWELRKNSQRCGIQAELKEKGNIKAQIFSFPSILLGTNSGEITDPELQLMKI